MTSHGQRFSVSAFDEGVRALTDGYGARLRVEQDDERYLDISNGCGFVRLGLCAAGVDARASWAWVKCPSSFFSQSLERSSVSCAVARAGLAPQA